MYNNNKVFKSKLSGVIAMAAFLIFCFIEEYTATPTLSITTFVIAIIFGFMYIYYKQD